MPTYRVRGPFIGQNTKKEPSTLALTEAQIAKNFVLDRNRAQGREGWEKKVTYAGTGAVTGMIDFRESDGTVRVVTKNGGQLYILDDFSSVALGSATFSDNELLDGAVINDRLYVGDGTDYKVTDGTSVFTPEITRPASALTVAGTGGSGQKGVYDYKYTFYSSTWGQESPSSDASAVEQLDDETANLTGFSVAPDARVDNVRIYRRKTSIGESDWRFVTEQPHTIASPISEPYNDALKDNDVSLLTVAPLSYSDTLPAMEYFAYQEGVLYSVSNTFPTRIYFSRASRPWVVDNFFELEGAGGGDAEAVKGIAAFQSVLVVFKENSIWILSGNSEANFSARKVVEQVGCRSHHSIQQVGNLLYFLSEEGIFAFDGANVREISRPIQSEIIGRDYSRDRYVTSVHDYERNALIWAWSSSGSTTNDKCFVYFYRNSQILQEDSWSEWQWNAGSDDLSVLGLVTDKTTKKRLVGVGFESKELGVYAEGKTLDDVDKITTQWRTGKVDVGFPEHEKSWKELVAEIKRQTTAGAVITPRILLDHSTSLEPVGGPHSQSDPVLRRRVRRRSRDLTLDFLADAPVEIIGWTQQAELVGRA